MTQVGEAYVSVKADTTGFQVDVEKGVKVGLNVAMEEVEKFERSLRQSFDRAAEKMQSVGDGMADVGKKMSVGLTLPIVGFGTAMFRAAGDFEASMNQVLAVTGATGAEFESLSAQAQQLGATTKFSAGEAAQAMGFLGMAGFNTTEILGAMPSVLQLAAAANLDIATSADIASNILAGYALTTEDLAAVNDALVQTTVATNTELIGVGEAMKYVGPVAQSAGVSINETAAAIGLLGNAGISGSMAGTTLRGVISNLLTVSGPAADVIERLGLVTTDSAGNFIGLVSVVKQLEEAGASTADLMTIFGDRAGPGMAALISQGSDALVELVTQLDNSGGIADQIATIQMQGLKGAMDELSSAVEGLFISMAESGLLSAFTDIIKKITEVVAKLSEASPALMRFVGIVAGIAAVVGPAVFAIGKISTAIGQTIQFAQKAIAAISSFVATASTMQLALGGIGLVLGAAAGAWLLFSGGSDTATDSMARSEEQAKRLAIALNSLEGVTPTLTEEVFTLAETSPLLRDALQQLGLDVGDVAAAFAQGSTATAAMIAQLAATQEGTGIAVDNTRLLAAQLEGLADALRVAERNAAELAQVVPEGADGQRLLAGGVDEATQALMAQEQAAAADAEALNDLLNATINAFRSQFDFERALGEVARQFLDYRKAVSQGILAGAELDEIQTDLVLSAMEVADAAAATAEQMAAAQGGTLSAAESAAIYVAELRRFAQALSPTDPVRRNLEALITTIETRLPQSITITVDANVQPAMSALGAITSAAGSTWEQIVYGATTSLETVAAPAAEAGERAGRSFGGGAARGIEESTADVVESAEKLVGQMNDAMVRAMESFAQAVADQLSAAEEAYNAAWAAIDARNAQEAATRRVVDAEQALADAHQRVADVTAQIAAGEQALVEARAEVGRSAAAVTTAEGALAAATRDALAATQATEAANLAVARAQDEVTASKQRLKAATDAAKAAADAEKQAQTALATAQSQLDTAKRRRNLAGVVAATQAVAAAEAEVARRQAAAVQAQDAVNGVQVEGETAAQALAAAQEAARAAKEADRLAADAVRQAQQALTQAQREAEQAARAAAQAEKALADGRRDLANAQRSVLDATRSLEEANRALLKVSEDLLDQGPEAEANFRRIAEAAGLEKVEIDNLIVGYRNLTAARRDAAAAAEAQIAFERELARTQGTAAIDSSVKALQNKMWEIQQMPRGADSSAAQRQAATLAVTAAEAYANAAAAKGTPAWNTVFKDSLGYFLNAYPMLSDELAGIRRAIGLANGGIVTSPTLAQIGEGSRPEAVIPLTRPRRALDLMEQSGLANLARQTAGSTGSLITMNGVTIAGPTDVDLVAQRVNAAVRARLAV